MAGKLARGGTIVNNVIFFLKKYMHSGTPEAVIKCGQGKFRVKDIARAKVLLIDHCKDQIDNIDNELSRRVIKKRRNGRNRATDVVNLRDIYDILDALSSHDVRIDVAPANINLIPNYNPESVTDSAVSTRIGVLEKKRLRIYLKSTQILRLLQEQPLINCLQIIKISIQSCRLL